MTNNKDSFVSHRIESIDKNINDIKNSVQKISEDVSEVNVTLGVQANQLAEHMRRTDALETIVENNERMGNTFIIDTVSRLTSLEESKKNTDNFKARDLVIWGIVISVISLLAQLLMRQ